MLAGVPVFPDFLAVAGISVIAGVLLRLASPLLLASLPLLVSLLELISLLRVSVADGVQAVPRFLPVAIRLSCCRWRPRRLLRSF
jgi:hypothetical protein